ncbi:MAG: queuosine precursor transporter [Deltaproteobacteria bacterium]|jgi:uncharacterized integral membrane protein (TIGR00697 family)|nr:queuosine precursor transporter [Deltaproteobacteria bacterium]
MPEKKDFRSLELISGLFAGLLIIANVCSARIISVGPMSFDAGTLTFPLTYIFGDILTEVYGYARARRVIWTAFVALLLSFLAIHLVSLFPPAEGWDGGPAWDKTMALTPRIAVASLAAFLAGEFANACALSRLKARDPKKGPALRFVFSTLVGQALDTALFATIAFLGTLGTGLFVTLLVSNYAYKCAIEIILLPVTLLVVKRLKKSEGADHVDRDVSLSPFAWGLGPSPGAADKAGDPGDGKPGERG